MKNKRDVVFDQTHRSTVRKKKALRNYDDKFSQQKITFDTIPLLFPPGLEGLFSFIYFMILPYIAGHMFFFFYVAKSKMELFLSIYEHSSFILTWAIGYEILAVLILLYIIKLAISFTIKGKSNNNNFKRPH